MASTPARKKVIRKPRSPGKPRVSTKPVARKPSAKAKPRTAAKPVGVKHRKPGAATRVRRTASELFLSKLTELSEGGKQLVSNPALRGALGWDEPRYKRIKAQLSAESAIIVGRGYGGSVGLAAGGGAGSTLKVFVSYSHADEGLKDAVMKHLKPLERMGLITAWHDRKLLAGDVWDKEISRNLEEADIVLLLVSIDFINSKYCYDVELDRALERDAEGSCRVVPVILRGCLWQHSPFAKLQALPRDGKPAASWPDLDEAFANVAEGIRAMAEDILANR